MKAQSWNNDWQFRNDDNGQSQQVTLPHDAKLMLARTTVSGHSAAQQAYYPGGQFTYQHEFMAPASWQDQHVVVKFEGVYKNASVYLNDQLIGSHRYGYTQFVVSLDRALNYGETNTLRVAVDDSEQPDSRWYTGAGIYRPVWLMVGPASGYIRPDGVRVQTVAAATKEIRVTTSIHGEVDEVRVTVLDGETVLATATGTDATLTLPTAQLWAPAHPQCYRCVVQTYQAGAVVDTATTTFGIRQISWGAEGFKLNGESVLLRGGCLHHSQGLLGAATFAESEYRRIKLLKEAGFNAVRSAHNPLSRAALEACDRLGMLVLDELWDMWFIPKNPHDYSKDWRDHYQDDIRQMVNKDYNHPAVIMYSIGNEVGEPATPEGFPLVKQLVAAVHRQDATRPVTAGLNLMILQMQHKGKSVFNPSTDQQSDSAMGSAAFNAMANVIGPVMNQSANSKKADRLITPIADELDIAGYNYGRGRYSRDAKLHPQRVIFGSETFPSDLWKNWQLVEQYPQLIGDFMWTAWDYLGEVGLGAWGYSDQPHFSVSAYPGLTSGSGVFDITGHAGAELGFARAVWHLATKPYIGVRPLNHSGEKLYKTAWRGTNAEPSWSWAGCAGAKATVEVYSEAAKIELRLNGQLVGTKRPHHDLARFTVAYQPGTLTATAFAATGQATGETTLTSAATQLGVTLLPEHTQLRVGDIAYVPITVADDAGTVEMNHDVEVTGKVTNGELLALGSAKPDVEEPFITGSCTTYYGRALAIVRASAPGSLTLTVTSALGETSTTITVQ